MSKLHACRLGRLASHDRNDGHINRHIVGIDAVVRHAKERAA